jgi:cell division protein FtsA
MPTRLWSGKVSEMKNNMITALDIGSSFVRVLIAKTAKDNSLEVLGSSEVPSSGIEKGIVKDIEAVSECVKKALQEAEKASGLKAVNIFTNITGEHIRSNVGDGRISIPSESPNEPGEISQDHVDQVINDAKNGIKILKGYERATILHGIPQSFVIDGQDDIHNPVKMNGFHLITKVYTIFGDITPLRNLAKCIELAGYDIDPDNFVLNHIAVSEAVLTEDEKRLGTVLIDIGGGTCDISLFRKGVLEKVMVVPMAGSAITEDLAIGLKTTISSAEYIKKEYGNAYAASVDPNVEIEVDGISGRESHSRTQYLVSHVIQHRVEEMLSLCYDKLKNCYTPELVTAGIVLTGGTARLQQIDRVVESAFNMHTKIARPNVSRLTGLVGSLDDPAWATAVGLLYHVAALDRELKTSTFSLGKIKNNKIFDSIKKIIKDFTTA